MACEVRLPKSSDPPHPDSRAGTDDEDDDGRVKRKVWVVFGATSHIGRSIVRTALQHNDLVAAVGWTKLDTPSSVLHTLCGDSSFKIDEKRCLPLTCDVRMPDSVHGVLQRTLQRWHRYDVVANCAKYGVIGPCEDQDENDLRDQMDTNFGGVMNMLRASLPYFRTRGQSQEGEKDTVERSEAEHEDEESSGGRYLFFSTTTGALGLPGLGPYCASKFAVEGLVESMLYETAVFDIKATLIELGYLRHDEHEGKLVDAEDETTIDSDPQSKHAPFGNFSVLSLPPDSAYASPHSPSHHARRTQQWLGNNKHHPTSARRCAELVWQLAHCRFPPLRLLLGAMVVDNVRDRFRSVTEEIEDWKWLNFSEEDPRRTGQRDTDDRMADHPEHDEEHDDESDQSDDRDDEADESQDDDMETG